MIIQVFKNGKPKKIYGRLVKGYLVSEDETTFTVKPAWSHTDFQLPRSNGNTYSPIPRKSTPTQGA